MRVSLWQQFSSNHSATFTVVGTFKSTSDAQQAANELKGIVDALKAWWDALDEEQRNLWLSRRETEQLTPIEQELSEKYQVEWPFALDWFYHDWFHEPVHVIGEHVFVQNPHMTLWNGPQPFDDLLKKLGAEVALDIESESHQPTQLFIDASFQAPDEEEATFLYEQFNEDFDAYRQDFWKADQQYSPNLDLNFNYETLTVAWNNPTLRLYEAERDRSILRLFGLSFYGGSSIRQDIELFILFLESRGYKDIRLSFYTHVIRRQS